MNRKGFTLIELLTVIIILAVIVVIVVPIVLNVVNDAKKSSAEINMRNLEKAANLYFQENYNDENIIFECSEGKCEFDGKQLELNVNFPQNGRIIIDKKGNITYEDIVINGFNCYKEHDKFVCDTKKTRKEYKESEIVINSKIEQNLLDYNISGNSIQNETTLQYENVGNKTSNIFDSSKADVWNGWYTNLTNINILGKAGEKYNGYTLIVFPVSPSTTYTIYYPGKKFTFCGTEEYPVTGSTQYSLVGLKSDNIFTFTTPSNVNYIAMYLGSTNLGYPAKNNTHLYEGEYTLDTLPYEPYGKYKIPVQVSGKNLFNYTLVRTITNKNLNGNISTIDVNISSGEMVTVSADIDATLAGTDINAVSLVLTYEDDTTYTYYYWNDECIKIPKGMKGRSYTTLTTTKNVKKVTFTAHTFNDTDGGTTIFSNYQIEIGNTINYEPYYNVTTNIYLDEPLRKVGDKADYIDFKNQKVVRYIEEDSEGNLKVLSVPKEEKIELPDILLRKGINNIEIDTSVKPSKIELEYNK